MTTIFISLYDAPIRWQAELEAMGIKYSRWEPQPQADQVKLHECTEVPETIPAWMRKIPEPSEAGIAAIGGDE